MITIFPNPNSANSERQESQKISYWLEKLFKQGEKRAEDEEKNRLSEKKSSSIIDSEKTEGIPQIRTEQESEERGQEEVVKEHVIKTGADEHKLDDMMTNTNRIIMSTSSMFPWDIFPSTINVEERRVTIIHRKLFGSQVHSVDIKNISNVFINTSLFFTAITIVSSTFEENKITIMKLRKKEAVLARRLIEGLRMFIEQDLDTSKYKREELINKLKELSTTKTMF